MQFNKNIHENTEVQLQYKLGEAIGWIGHNIEIQPEQISVEDVREVCVPHVKYQLSEGHFEYAPKGDLWNFLQNINLKGYRLKLDMYTKGDLAGEGWWTKYGSGGGVSGSGALWIKAALERVLGTGGWATTVGLSAKYEASLTFRPIAPAFLDFPLNWLFPNDLLTVRTELVLDDPKVKLSLYAITPTALEMAWLEVLGAPPPAGILVPLGEFNLPEPQWTIAIPIGVIPVPP